MRMKTNEMFQLGEALRLAGERLCVPSLAERLPTQNSQNDNELHRRGGKQELTRLHRNREA